LSYLVNYSQNQQRGVFTELLIRDITFKP